MKTTKIFSVLSLVLIFTAFSSAFSFNTGKKEVVPANPVVRHQVNIQLESSDLDLCNTYLVEILDGNGRLVATPKRYIPSESKYIFYERGPANGVRVAVLVLAPTHSQFQCERELFTEPVLVFGPFEAGSSYRYDLFPELHPAKH
jgi:hypothetical protein